MKIKEIFDLVINLGIEADFKEKITLKKILKKEKKNMRILALKRKKFLI